MQDQLLSPSLKQSNCSDTVGLSDLFGKVAVLLPSLNYRQQIGDRVLKIHTVNTGLRQS